MFSYFRVLRNPVQNDPRSGLLQRSGGFSSSGKNEYLCTFIIDQGNAYLDLRGG